VETAEEKDSPEADSEAAADAVGEKDSVVAADWVADWVAATPVGGTG
jgi:hypothetical protein